MLKMISGVVISMEIDRRIFLSSALTSAFAAEADRPIRLMVITGGHALNAAFFGLFEGKWQHREHAPKSTATAYSQPINEVDAVVLYDMPKQITDAEKANFLALFERGVGVVFLHHALCALQDWPAYDEITGVRLREKTPGGALPKFIYQHDVDFDLQRVDMKHPVLDGVTSFRVHDETYGNMFYHPGLQPLLVTSQPGSMPVVAWTRQVKASRTVSIQPGHGPEIFKEPNYRRLVANAIRWVAKRT